MQLTRNFARSEFDVSGAVPPQYEGNVTRLANLLQYFRDIAGVPLDLTDVYRTELQNDAIPDSVSDSQHLTASAADGYFRGLSNAEVWRRLEADERVGRAPLYGQFIVYNDDGHVHISLPHTDGRPDRQKLVANKEAGHRVYTLLERASQIVASHRTAVVVLLLCIGLAFFFPLAH